MILRRKRPPAEAFALVRCGSCGAELRRRFAAGDLVFAGAECAGCGGAARIEAVYGEVTGRR